MSWFLYVAQCSDGSLYTGVTTDVERRIREHNGSKRGAKYTRNKRPVKLVYSRVCKGRSEAQREEYKFKSLSRKEKLKIISKSP